MTEFEYDAFLSSSDALDGTLAPALRRGVQRFAKPWYRSRSLKVFLDDGQGTPSEDALSRSRWLILMASQENAGAERVEWWLEHRSAQQILVVLTSGEYARSVPAAVRKALGEDPRWVDLRWLRSASHVDDANPRFRECVADIASAVRGVPKDDLVGEHVRQHRRTTRLARGAAAALTVIVLLAALIAVVQRNDAVSQTRTVTARSLASAAVANLRTDLALSQVLAAEAYRVEPNAQTRSALFASLTASPQLDRYVQVGGEVTALAASADGKVAVAGTSDGRVVRLDLTTSSRSETRIGPSPVTAVATSANGGVIAAFSTGTAVRWDGASAVQRFEVPSDLKSGLVAVSPSGRFTALHADGDGRFLSIVHDGQNDHRAQRDGSAFPLLVLRMPDDETVLELSDTEWARRSPISQEVLSTSRGEVLPATGYWFGASANGAHFGWSTDGLTRLWHTTTPTFGYNTQDAEVRYGRPTPSSVAITNDGTRTAVADTGTIYLYDMTGSTTGELARLDGNSETPFVEFLGSSDRLVSASRDHLVLWDLTRNTRLSSTLPTRSPLSCNACPAPWLATSHGRTAVTAGAEVTLGPSSESVGPDSDFGPPAWNSTGDKLYLVTLPEGIGETWQTQPVLRRESRWKGDVTAEHLVAMRAAPDDSRLVTVNEQGDVQVFSAPDFTQERTIPLGRRLDHAGWPPAAGLAAISADTSTAAVVTANSVELIDTTSGTRRSLDGPAEAVTFTDNNLLIQRSGFIEIWDSSATSHRKIQSDPNHLPGITAAADLAVQLRRDHVMVLTDLTTGERVGQVPLVSPRARFGRIGTAFDGPERLITAIPHSRLTAWDLSEENWVRTACASAARTLTAEEWRRHVGTEPPSDLTCD
ncbi:WD40 repeat domain-containing protein [Lentzea sp.]|uniref:WD40 repeat domain-containing protein n=1 Tax=Lentzea sp. TaxID=56099 RepID=UPI002CC25BE8|nr:WD40 repeat domain-containing protein [Lentzea sp.]HUQ55494.1 WD40 repeat domain-containing protein [Lentzea sp.]